MTDTPEPNETVKNTDRLGGPRWLGWVQRVWLWGGWLAFGVFAGRFVLHFLDPLPAVAFFLTLIAFCFPGWVFLSLLWGGESASHQPELWLWGAALGIIINIWVVLIEGYITGHAAGWSILGLDLLCIVAWFMYARWRGGWPLPLRAWTFGERALWLVVSLWTLAFMSHACLPIITVDPDGTVLYPGAFATDLLAQMSACSSVSLALPHSSLAMTGFPAPVESGISLLSAVGRGWMDPTGPVTSWVVLANLFVAIGFGGVLVSVMRAFIANLRGLVLAVFVVYFSYGFYWLVVWLRPEAIGTGSMWLDRVIGPSIYRWMLAQPQVLLTAALVLSAVAWIASAARPTSRTGMAGFGILSGLIASVDYRFGWIVVVIGIVWVGTLLVVHRHDRPRLGMGALLFAAGCLLAILPYWVLRIQAPHLISQLVWEISWSSIAALPGRLGLLFGPIVILSIWGLVRRLKDGNDFYAPFIHAAALLLGFLLLTVVRVPGGSLLPGLATVFVALVLGMGWVFSDEEIATGVGRWVVLAVILLGLPGFVWDFQSLGSQGGAGDAIAVHPSDYQSALWAQEFLPVDAVIQSSPDYRNYGTSDTLGNDGIAWAASLAQRRMIAGPRRLCAGIADSIQSERRWQVAEMLGSAQPDSLHARARRLGVEYIYVGPAEAHRRPRLRARMAGSPELFEAVYDQDSAAIFRVYPQ